MMEPQTAPVAPRVIWPETGDAVPIDEERREKQVADVRAGNPNVSISDCKLVEMLLDDPACRDNATSIDFLMADLGQATLARSRGSRRQGEAEGRTVVRAG